MADITGTNRNDTLEGTDNDDLIRGLDGNDELDGKLGNDTISGDNGDDDLSGWKGDDLVNGGAGNDSIYGDSLFPDSGKGNDIANGGTGYDQIWGGEGNDTLRGQAGNDTLYGGAGDDVLDGGSEADPFWRPEWQESDRVSYEVDNFGSGVAGTGVIVNLSTGVALDNYGGTDTLIDIEEVRGTHRNDTLIGGNVANDNFEGFTGGGGNDKIDGGSGFDVASYRFRAEQAIIAQLKTGKVFDSNGGVDTVSNVEMIVATDYDDRLFGSDGSDGFAPCFGSDYINGGAGSDTVNYRYGISSGTFVWGLDADLERGFIFDPDRRIDEVVSIENVVGSTLGDTIRGSRAANMLDGQDGNDLLKGRSGNDDLRGDYGADHLDGGTGTDMLNGGVGNDTLRGGGLGDTFVFGTDCDEDHVLDFKTGADKIDVSAFGFDSSADVLAKLVILSPSAAMLDLGSDNYVIFDYVNTANTVLAAGDIII